MEICQQRCGNKHFGDYFVDKVYINTNMTYDIAYKFESAVKHETANQP